MKNPVKTEGVAVDPIEAASNVIAKEGHVALPRKVIEQAVAAYEAAKRRLPALKCEKCGNGVDVIWNNCPWCGAEATWQAQRPGPQPQLSSKSK